MSHENLSDIEKMDNNNLNRIVSLLPTGEKKYNLSNKVKIIGREAFKYNMSFEQIFLHDNIEFIEQLLSTLRRLKIFKKYILNSN